MPGRTWGLWRREFLKGLQSGSLLFIMFTNDLPERNLQSGLGLLADDCSHLQSEKKKTLVLQEEPLWAKEINGSSISFYDADSRDGGLILRATT